MNPHPELLVVAAEPQDDLNLMFLKGLLVERGIDFVFDERDRLPQRLPAALSGFKAILVEKQLQRRWTRRDRQRIARYRARGGYCRTFDRYPGVTTFCNLAMEDLVRDILVNASITSNNQALAARLAARSDDDAVRRALRTFATYRDSLITWDDRAGWPWRLLEELEDVQPGQGHIAAANALIETAIRKTPNLVENLDRIIGLQCVLRRYAETAARRYLEYAQKRIDRVIATYPRVAGALVLWPERDRCLWTETLMGFCPSAACLWRATGKRQYLDEAVNQIRTVARINQDCDGLWFHGGRRGERLGAKWGRGNGWAALGIVETLRHLPDDHPFLREGGDMLRRFGEGLAAVQDCQTGLWRNLLTHPASRIECSGSGLFVYCLATALRRGWLGGLSANSQAGGRIRLLLERAWTGLKSRLFDGWLMTQAVGTGVGPDERYYLARPQHHGRPNQFLLAAGAMLKLRSGCAK